MAEEVVVRRIGKWSVARNNANGDALLRLSFTDHPDLWFAMDDHAAAEMGKALEEVSQLPKTIPRH